MSSSYQAEIARLEDEIVRLKADFVVDYIVGTVKSVADGLRDLGFDEGLENNAAFCSEIDDKMFVCGSCDWACGRDEESEDQPGNCDECCPNGDRDHD